MKIEIDIPDDIQLNSLTFGAWQPHWQQPKSWEASVRMRMPTHVGLHSHWYASGTAHAYSAAEAIRLAVGICRANHVAEERWTKETLESLRVSAPAEPESLTAQDILGMLNLS